MSIIIAPSILAANFGNLSRDCEIIDKVMLIGST